MPDSKYIGLGMAIVGSFAIGTSTVITKMGLTASADGTPSSENMSFLRNSMWWAGMAALVVGEAANFGAYTFAPPVMVTPLGALSVIVGAIFASFLLNERLGHLGRVGCALCILGSSIIVLHAPDDKDLETVTQFLEYAVEPGFLLYCFTITLFTLVMIYGVAPKHGRTNPLVYISIASLVGSVSVMFVKGFTVALKLSLSGSNQFMNPSTYIFALIAAGCIVIQLNYANKALDLFNVNLVNPIYYVGFCSATIVASLILFKGFNTSSATNTVSLLCGFVVTFLGVHVLNIAMLDESLAKTQALNARGDVAIDGGSPWNHHARRSSLTGLNGLRTPLFGAFAVDAEPPSSAGGETLRLHRLLEEDEFEDAEGYGNREDEGDERMALRSGSGSGSRHHNIRISPRPV
ncbi:hypothetical protein MSAN_02259700 [Mycena sanguinolenta]|uniref:DUF803-domain-containing protein n=1 Tax=Mycena sanguinolenta TaxID=230812 RepID=A0A8H6XB08_9AGAR|nr:hypothetical protein MSAN_02259700 [Mycena sanguinolenta]